MLNVKLRGGEGGGGKGEGEGGGVKGEGGGERGGGGGGFRGMKIPNLIWLDNCISEHTEHRT
jgi:hypothetical protein